MSEAFQKQHGEQWAGMLQTDAFASADGVVLDKELAKLRDLPDEEIAKHGSIILAGFCGFLRHAGALLALPTEKEFKFGAAPAEDYPDAEKEFIEQADQSRQTPQAEPPPAPSSPAPRKPRNKRK